MSGNKRVLGICGSGRQNGNTSIILDELLKPAREADCDVQIINLGRLEILPCRGCFACSSSYQCVLRDDLNLIKSAINDADAIALALPCYYLSAPSAVKAVMDRLASWAINEMANNVGKKYGVAVSVAGGAQSEFSLQRVYASLFLGLFNCQVTGQMTIGHTFNRGEILLMPNKLRQVSELGENLLRSLQRDCCIRSNIRESGDNYLCAKCLADVFQVYRDGSLICPVCGERLDSVGSDSDYVGFNRFSAEGAREHREHIVENVVRGMLASDEISRRLEEYLKNGTIPEGNFQVDTASDERADAVEWERDVLDILKKKVPAALVELFMGVIGGKAFQHGEMKITKNIIGNYLPKF